MKWNKKGLVYVATGESSWAHSHAYLPTPVLLNNDVIRVFLSFRDRQGMGRVGYVDIAADNPKQILNISSKPALDIGQAGVFDDHGVTPISVVKADGKLFLFYTGWQLGRTVPYYMFTGLAVSVNDGETFERFSYAPILDRSNNETFTRTAAHVKKEGSIWHMWYAAGKSWIKVNNKMMPTYDIRYLTSASPDKWHDRGYTCLCTEGDDEFGLGRPYVLKTNSQFKLIYSIRTKSKGYRLGYAESSDGLNWQRKDNEIGIDVSESGWDSTMICFAAIQPTKYGTYMFYNGNNYGETGFGVAILDD